MKNIIHNLLKKFQKQQNIERSIAVEKTSNHLIFNTDLPMKKRILAARQQWVENGKKWDYTLTGDAFFAAQCWVFTMGLYDTKSDNYDPDISEFIQKCRSAVGGDQGWVTLLNQRTHCDMCGAVFKKENILFCVCCMRFVCIECKEAHILNCGDCIVG